MKRACKKRNLTIPNDTSKHIVTEQVNVISPQSLLKAYDLTEITLLQIDTEGYDYEVIKLFDIEHTKPEAIIYENIHLSASDKAACILHLKNNGYKVTNFDANTLAILDLE